MSFPRQKGTGGSAMKGALTSNTMEKPSHYLRRILPELTGRKRPRRESFQTEENGVARENYDREKVNAVRANDVSAVRALLQKGKSFDAHNSNGETLLHLACRRSTIEMVRFLILEARVKVNVQDDMGRTILHDVCWRPTPNIDMMETLINLVSPELFVLEDTRGHTCLDYTRESDWKKWNEFLRRNANVLKRRSDIVDSVSSNTTAVDD